jgi:hypothetical protein
MGDISFVPTFQHNDWVDDVDRVEAAGGNGFNVRFRAINSDLRQVSTVVGQVGAKLDTIVANPPLPLKKLTLTPLFTRGPIGNHAWTTTVSAGAQGVLDTTGNPPTPTTGNLDLTLEDGIQLVSLRAIGQATATTVSITLVRRSISNAAADPPLAQLIGDANPFDKTVTVDPGRNVVDLASFRYQISATTTSPVTQQPVAIGALQITYIPV